MEMHAYYEDYVSSAQRILGDMFDFAVNSCDLELDEVFRLFIVSGLAKQFENGNPAFVAGITGCELLKKVYEELNLEIPNVEDEMYMDKSPEYWAGWALAYYQWVTGKMFHRIGQVVSMKEILCMYSVYHEMDIAKFVEAMNEKIKAYYQETNLKRYRKIAELSQKQLADLSGVPVRQIQLFEQRQRNINKTQAVTLWRMGRALGCTMEELLEV